MQASSPLRFSPLSSGIMKILCARYPKSPADLAAVWDGPTAEKADFRSQTEPEKIKHLQEQLRAAKVFICQFSGEIFCVSQQFPM